MHMTYKAHGGKFACPYCEGECNLDGSATLRTFGRIRKWHEQFLASGGKEKNAKEYKNCVRALILKANSCVNMCVRECRPIYIYSYLCFVH